MRLLTLALAAGMMMQASTPSLCNPKDKNVDCSITTTTNATRNIRIAGPQEPVVINGKVMQVADFVDPINSSVIKGLSMCACKKKGSSSTGHEGGAVQSDPCTKLGWGPCVESQVPSAFHEAPLPDLVGQVVTEAVQERVENLSTVECGISGETHDCTVRPFQKWTCKDGDSVLFESQNGKRHICVRF